MLVPIRSSLRVSLLLLGLLRGLLLLLRGKPILRPIEGLGRIGRQRPTSLHRPTRRRTALKQTCTLIARRMPRIGRRRKVQIRDAPRHARIRILLLQHGRRRRTRPHRHRTASRRRRSALCRARGPRRR